MSDDTLLEFPCQFPIKVMGKNTEQVRQAVQQTASEHASDSSEMEIIERASRTGKYLSFTVTLTFQSKEQLDALYQRFTVIEGVSMVL